MCVFFFKQKTAYEMRISDWSSDVCSSDLILLHRGYPIGQLAEQSSFMEVAYLLMRGELPGKDELDEFIHTITRHTMVHEQLAMFYSGFRRDAHPMAIMCGVVGALSAFYHDSTDIDDPHQRMLASHRLISQIPTIGAKAFNYSVGQPFPYPTKLPQPPAKRQGH